MKRALAVAVLSLLTLAASPSEAAPPPITRVADGTGARLAMRRAEVLRQRQVTPSAILIDASGTDFVIPSAGSIQGANGAFFRSDVTIVNHRDTPQDVMAVWLARDSTAGENTPTFELTIPAGPYSVVTYRDIVGDFFGLQGLGAIWFVGIDDAGDEDFEANLDGFSRIWTPQPGTTGTVSQQFPAATLINLFTEAEAYALGLRVDSQYRMNIGIVNLDAAPQTFSAVVVGGGVNIDHPITVPPFGMKHITGPSQALGDAFVVFRPATEDAIFWTAYATSNDNVTGDGWVALPSFPLPEDGETLTIGRKQRASLRR